MTTIDDVIKKLGGVDKVAADFDYTSVHGVYKWKTRGIPSKFVKRINEKTRISFADLYQLTGEGLERV